MNKIYEGVYGSHAGRRVLAHKVVRMGYYWPEMYADSTEVVQRCKKCQQFTYIQSIPPKELTPISSPWPFEQWGVDIVGPLLAGKGGVKFAIVAMDYFTKWAEAEALASITTQNVTRFLWKSVVTIFAFRMLLSPITESSSTANPLEIGVRS